MIFLLSFPIPIIIAVLFGLNAGRRDPQSMRAFWNGAAIALLWAMPSIFLWHALWITSLLPGRWTGTVQSAMIWTLATGAIWLPVLMISYVWRAMKERRGN